MVSIPRLSFGKRLANTIVGIFKSRTRPSAPDLAMRQVLAVRAKGFPTLAQWRLLPRFLNATEKKIASVALIIAIGAASTLGINAYLNAHATVPAYGGEYTEGVVGVPKYINPLYSSTSDVDADLSRLIFSGLMRHDPVDGLVPDLATSFQISEDQKTYTFTLRDNAVWHDGKPVTVQDVLFTISAIQNPDYHSPLAVSFAGVTVESSDAHTIAFQLDEPFSPFLAALTVGILPSHLWQEVPPANAQLAAFNLKPIGSGPFAFEKLKKDNMGNLLSMTVSSFDAFYSGKPYINELTFKFYSSVSELTDALHNRNVEGASVVTAGDVATLSNDRALSVLRPSLPQFTAAFFNQKRSSVLADDNVRMALSLAVDRTSIAQTAYGSAAKPITSPVLDTMPGYTEPNLTSDIALANSTLDTAGWTFAEGATVRSKGTTPLSFVITTLDSAELLATAQELEKAWEAIGASVDIAVVDATTLQTDTLKNRSYDVLVAGERYGTFADPYPFFHSSQANHPGLNLGSFSSQKADKAIETARETNNDAQRAEAMTTLQTAISEEIPAVFLYQPSYTFAVSSKIQGIEIPSVTIPSDRFSRVKDWFIKTKRAWRN